MRSQQAAKIKVQIVLGIIISAFIGTALASPAVHAVSTDVFTGASGKCIDVKGGQAKPGAKVQLYSCNQSAAQNWSVGSDGTVRNHNLCLDVKGGRTTAKTYVQLYACNGTKSQRWLMNANGTVTSALSNLCLDNSYGKTVNANPVWVYSCNSSVSQKWSSPAIQAVTNKAVADQAAKQAAEQKAQQDAAAKAAADKAAADAAAATQNQSSGSGYTNSTGNYVQSPGSNPAGATARCVDGTYSYSQSHRGTCSHHGGVAEWL